MKAIVADSDILDFIPQRPPFVMVDKLFEIGERSLRSGFTVKSDNVLLVRNQFQESGLAENMAQTAALFAGFKAHQMGKETPLGYIGAIKNLQVKSLPMLGDCLFTEVEIVNEVMNVQIANAKVCDSKMNELASCELRIFIKQD